MVRLYQVSLGASAPRRADDPLWWTNRKPFRALTYHAARAMFTRASQELGVNWSLHGLRHTAAYRMARDPQMPLCDVQWVLGHVHLSATQLYLTPAPAEVIAEALAHHDRRRQAADAAAAAAAGGGGGGTCGGYRAESLAMLFSERSS